MRVLKQNPILRLVNSYLVDSPQPINISYLWNFGSLLALCLGFQIITGVFLVMHYCPNVDFAFDSVEHIMRDVEFGWILRYIHANVASFFFIFVYAHMARGLYYNSYKSPRVAPWSIGVIILILMIAQILIAGLNCIEYFYWINFDNEISQAFMASLVCFSANNRLRARKRIGPHNYNVLCIIIGGLLGDMWGTLIPGQILNSVRFGLEQSIKNIEYLMSVWKELKLYGYCSDVEPITTPKANGNFNIRFYLYTFTSLLWVFEGFYTYVDGKYIKSVPVWIDLYLSPLAIAHWFMQDGSRQHGQGVFLATNSFTYDDTLRLANLLSSKYGLKTSVIKTGTENQWRISIWKRSMPQFVSLVRPHMHPSMLYKLEGYV